MNLSSILFSIACCFSFTTTTTTTTNAEVVFRDILPDVPEGNCPSGAGGSSTWTGTCDSRGYVFTPQCSVTQTYEGPNNEPHCTVEPKTCGCQYYYEHGGVGYIGVYYHKGCGSCTGQADSSCCAKFSDNFPDTSNCQLIASMLIEGRCDSRNYVFSTQCSLTERYNSERGAAECLVEPKECGCRMYEEGANGSYYVTALSSNYRRCDPCDMYHSDSSATHFLRTKLDYFVDGTFYARKEKKYLDDHNN